MFNSKVLALAVMAKISVANQLLAQQVDFEAYLKNETTHPVSVGAWLLAYSCTEPCRFEVYGAGDMLLGESEINYNSGIGAFRFEVESEIQDVRVVYYNAGGPIQHRVMPMN